MTDPQTQAPTRLLDDPDLSGALRHDLELAEASAPLNYNVDAGLARFEQTLSAGVAPASVGATALGVRVLAWFLGGAVLVGTSIGAASLVSQANERKQRSVATLQPIFDHERARAGDEVAEAPPVATTSPEVASSAVETPTPDPTADAPTLESGDVGDGGLDSADAPPRPDSDVPIQQPTGSLADEAKQINAARKALTHDPAKTLELVEAAAEAFPRGAMIQEREGYAVLALAALGRAQEAQSRGQAYLERWPNGTLARRVADAIR